MIETLIISSVLVGTTIYLSLNKNAQNSNSFDFDQQHSLIEFLTQHKTVSKNYSSLPQQFISHGKWNVYGEINGDVATLNYTFPLINKDEHEYVTNLHPKDVSSTVSSFVHSGSGFPNHKQIVLQSQELGKEISDSILKALQLKNNDTYFNRVQAALNFVQYIPYGIPDFDTNTHSYGGVSMPHESIILSYSDCDSKSMLFSSIIMNLISRENIVMIICNLSSDTGHMVVGVSGLDHQNGVAVEYNNKSFLVLETTAPTKIGVPVEIEVNEIITLI